MWDIPFQGNQGDKNKPRSLNIIQYYACSVEFALCSCGCGWRTHNYCMYHPKQVCAVPMSYIDLECMSSVFCRVGK